jgi:hypothetical protein
VSVDTTAFNDDKNSDKESDKTLKGSNKKKAKDPSEMKTFMRIPYSRAPEDPSWMSKVRAGRKMNPIEAN